MGNSLPVSACEACNVYRFCKSCAFGCFQCLNTIIIAFIIIYHAIVFFDVCECKITRYCDNLDIFLFFLLLGLFRIILCFNGTVYSFFVVLFGVICIVYRPLLFFISVWLYRRLSRRVYTNLIVYTLLDLLSYSLCMWCRHDGRQTAVIGQYKAGSEKKEEKNNYF